MLGRPIPAPICAPVAGGPPQYLIWVPVFAQSHANHSMCYKPKKPLAAGVLRIASFVRRLISQLPLDQPEHRGGWPAPNPFCRCAHWKSSCRLSASCSPTHRMPKSCSPSTWLAPGSWVRATLSPRPRRAAGPRSSRTAALGSTALRHRLRPSPRTGPPSGVRRR
jgi:hypothetical protein